MNTLLIIAGIVAVCLLVYLSNVALAEIKRNMKS